MTGFYCGGALSNTLAVRMGDDLGAAVPFYGGMPADPKEISRIRAAILVHPGEVALSGIEPDHPAPFPVD